MFIKNVQLFHIKIPLKISFKHASAERKVAENIIVRCESQDGIVGWGETIAREYVTGENLPDTIKRYKNIPKYFFKKDFKSVHDIGNFLNNIEFDKFNVARCGLELALIDMMAKTAGLPLHRFISQQFSKIAKITNPGPFYYGGAIGLSETKKTIKSSLKMRLNRFNKVKLKLEKDLDKDENRLAWVRRILGNKIDLRIDANEAWDMDYACAITPLLKKHNISAIEQPFPKDLFHLNKEFYKKSGIPIILDESLCSLNDAKKAVTDNFKSIFCVKLPKVGGIYNALQIFKFAKDNNIPIQLSCQVGESAILSAASRHIASLCPNLLYLEGSFDKYLLSQNVVRKDISFGFRGKANQLNEPGLGIDTDLSMVENLAVQSLEIYCENN